MEANVDRLEQAMKIAVNIERMALAGLLTLALASGTVWAQANAAPASKNSDAAADAIQPHDNTFIIGPDDVLAVNVWKEPEISRSVPVRSDGKISLPLVGEVQASGQTPHQLEIDIAKKLQSYISEPDVTVIVQEIKSKKFNVMGMVAKPGSYSLTNAVTVLDALALAGGFRDFAKQKSIFVLRQNADGTQARFPFNYKDVIKGKMADQNIKLQPGDTVYVP
jgi:polysaccharide biosynthesis/export protein